MRRAARSMERNIPFVKRDGDGAGREAGIVCNSGVQRLRRRVKAVSLINLFREGSGNVVEMPARPSIQNQLQQIFVALPEQFHPRRFINAAALDADEPVLHRVDADADSVSAADAVRL